MILETNAVSGLFRGDAALEKVLAAEERHQLPVIVVGEYRFGLAQSRARQQLSALLDQLIAESDVLEVDLETASVYAGIRTRLRERGEPIPENDIWIGALCLQHRVALVSRDAHFDSIAGLQRWTW